MPQPFRLGQTPARVLCLGDSYTIGEAVAPEERWPSQLVGRLRDAGMSVDDPQIVARTGWTTDELIAAIDGAGLSPPFDLVTLLIGVNDQYRGHALTDYGAGFERLLRYAVHFADGQPGRIIVLSIPDWSVTPFASGKDRAAVAREIDAFNDAARRYTVKLKATYLDLTEISRMAPVSWLASDSLHPGPQIHREWAEAVLPAARSILRFGASGLRS